MCVWLGYSIFIYPLVLAELVSKHTIGKVILRAVEIMNTSYGLYTLSRECGNFHLTMVCNIYSTQ